jgi:hypothetical protein
VTSATSTNEPIAYMRLSPVVGVRRGLDVVHKNQLASGFVTPSRDSDTVTRSKSLQSIRGYGLLPPSLRLAPFRESALNLAVFG